MSSPAIVSEIATREDVPVLGCRGMAKAYGHVHALRDATLSLRAGTVTGLVGDNGAGKSTLVRILAGLERPDRGDVLVDGASTQFRTPAAAHAAGVEVVYQDLALAPHLDAAGNIFLGRERRRRGLLGRLGFLDDRAMREAAASGVGDVGGTLAQTQPVGQLSGGQRQAVAVARALRWGTRALLLDEPTAALGAAQTRRVLDMVRDAAGGGSAVLLISHDLPEVVDVADVVVVLRQGSTVAELPRGAASPSDLLDLMMGLT